MTQSSLPSGVGAPAWLRVATVTETYPPEINGVALTTARLVTGLRVRGHRVQLVRPRQAGDGAAPAHPGGDEVLVAGLPIPRYRELRFGLARAATLAERWRRWRPDIVHVVTEGPLGWAAVRAARAMALPVVSDFHTNFHAYTGHYGIGWLRRPVAAWLRRLHNATDATLVPTAALARDLAEQGYRNLAVISRGVDTHRFDPGRRAMELRAAWGVADDGLAVIHVGRLAPEKNLQLVLRAFEAVRRVRPEARMVWVGDGPERARLEAQHPQHVFAGMRRDADLGAHFASADLFVFPSLSETFGNVTLEALASGLAVAAYAHAGAAELISHDVNGVLASPGDESEFVRITAALAGDRPRLTALRTMARASALSREWDAVCSAFELCLKETVRRHALRRRRQDADILLALR